MLEPDSFSSSQPGQLKSSQLKLGQSQSGQAKLSPAILAQVGSRRGQEVSQHFYSAFHLSKYQEAEDMRSLVDAVAICALSRVSDLAPPVISHLGHDSQGNGVQEQCPGRCRQMPMMPHSLADVLQIAERVGLMPDKLMSGDGSGFYADVSPFHYGKMRIMFYSGVAPENEVYAAVFCCIAKYLMSASVIEDLVLSGAVVGNPMAGMHLPSVLRRVHEMAATHRSYTMGHGFSSLPMALRFTSAPPPRTTAAE